MGGYTFEIYKTKVIFHNDEEKGNGWDFHYKHYDILEQLFNFMRSRNFDIDKDPYYASDDWKYIRDDHFCGCKKNLEFKAERYSSGFKLEFYQNINIENQHGGYYDFDKFEKMPYLIKKMFINETNKIKEFFNSIGIKEQVEPDTTLAEDYIKWRYVKSCHYPQKDMNFKLSDLDGQTGEYDYNRLDRDKKTIYNGQIKYYYDYKGRLARGKVYRNLNNMWWVIQNKYKVNNVAAYELFDPTSDDLKVRRKRSPYLPKEAFKRLMENNNSFNAILMKKLVEIYETTSALELKTIFKNACKRLGFSDGERKTKSYFKTSGDKYRVYLDASNTENKIQIVYRYEGGHYIILEYNGKRIFEYDTKAYNINKDLLNKCYKEYKELFDRL